MEWNDRIVYSQDQMLLSLEAGLDRLNRVKYDGRYSAALGESFMADLTKWETDIRRRKEDPFTPVVLVPTSFTSVREEEWKQRGANVIIYANQLMRAAVPAIQQAAETILRNHRAEECDAALMPFKEIIRMIPEE